MHLAGQLRELATFHGQKTSALGVDPTIREGWERYAVERAQAVSTALLAARLPTKHP
jgi:hypothetical protein